MKWKSLLLTCVSVGVLSGCAASTNNMSQPATSTTQTAQAGTLPGQRAPAFQLKTLDGSKTVALKDLLGKQPIFVNAWASWCHPCQLETPEIEKLSKEYAGKVQFVGVNMTSQEHPISDAQAFVKTYGITYTVLQDPAGTFLNDYNLLGFPTSFLILPDGKIAKVMPGMFKPGELNSWLQGVTKTS